MNSRAYVDQSPCVASQEGGRRAARFAFWFYKRCLSPIIHAVAPGGCRYLPTCSEYAYTAILRFGPLRGSWLALRRLLRCHPWAKGGLDTVPLAQFDSHDETPN